MDFGAPDSGRLDLCLVVPAFDAVNFPPLGISVIAAACRARGLSVKVLFGSLQLAAEIGYDAYKALHAAPIGLMIGEHLFRSVAYPDAQADTEDPPRVVPRELRPLYETVSPKIGAHQEAMAQRVIDLNPRILGIGSTFQQNLAAGGLARLVKAARPDITIVMGGANVAGPMGGGLAQVFPWIDHFFTGEADAEFPAFCERLVGGAHAEERLIHCDPIDDFRQVSAPDFTDFFAKLGELQAQGRLPPDLPEFVTMESSRGCWWGQKHHCTFCGLNGAGMDFRQKPADRVYDEIRQLTSTWSAERIFLADNIMPLNYLDELLPRLGAWPARPKLFYEVKANLNPQQIAVMARAGITKIQPGIESLSTNLLRLMRKGVSARQNLALLRTCRGWNVHVAWNHLYGMPGERLEDYEAVTALIPKIEHLQPPSGLHRIVFDRFSPYHDQAAEFGIGQLEPAQGYLGLYPDGAPLQDIAFHFSGDYPTPLTETPEVTYRLRLAIGVWKHVWARADRRPVLELVNDDGKLSVLDTRRIATERMTPVGPELHAALRRLERACAPESLSPEMAEHVRALVERDFVIDYEGVLMSVVTTPQTLPGASQPDDDAVTPWETA